MNFINAMQDKKENKFKIILDNILIYNLYILIGGALFLLSSFILSINGESKLFGLFQKLWYPVFIPSLSLFFTAILIEAIINQIQSKKNQ
tara:strand:- start:216 stop:485 length:270 start_codon:yes stop_codon:yes gene_type:complete